MNSNILPITVRALLIGEDISLRLLRKQKEIISNPPVVELADNSYAVLFRYGVVVFFNVGKETQTEFIRSVSEFINTPQSKEFFEDAVVLLRDGTPDGLDNNFIYVKELTLARIQLIATVLARSVILEKQESEVAKIMDIFIPVLQQLKNGSINYLGIKNLIKNFADGVLKKHAMVGKIEILDNPDMLWSNSDLEHFYLQLRGHYEVNDRFNNIEEKLSFISQTAESIFHLQHSLRSVRLEWYIVLLIVFEIVISFF
jgi:uncharacterized Rmd1/YagE family protein